MTQQAEMRSDAPSPIDWTHKVQELIKLLVEAVLMLPDNERRRGGLSVDILFEALLTLQKGLRNWFGCCRGLCWNLIARSPVG
jgi:hypothetical protein